MCLRASIYGVLAEESVGRMFLAGIVPGLVMALCFIVMILAMARFMPDAVIVPGHQVSVEHHETLGSAARKLTPLVALVALVLGGLYSGYFTPTEAGAVGAAGALVVTFLRGKINGRNSRQVIRETGYISVGILFLLIAAGMYSRMLTMAGIPMEVGNLIAHLGLGVYGFLTVYVLLVVLLGMILDSTSILLIVVPIAAPIAKALGLDLIHFGIITVIAVETGLLTPPFGISAFTVKSSLDDDKIKVETIFLGAAPYVAIMLAVIVLITLVPASTTWLARSF